MEGLWIRNGNDTAENTMFLWRPVMPVTFLLEATIFISCIAGNCTCCRQSSSRGKWFRCKPRIFSFSLSSILILSPSPFLHWLNLGKRDYFFFFKLKKISSQNVDIYKIAWPIIIIISLANIKSIKGEGKRFGVEGKVSKLGCGILFGAEAAERCVLSCRTRGTHWESVNSSLCRVCSVSSGADACPLPFRPPFPLPASSYPRRNRETSKLHARKAESSYLPDSRVATAPPFARSSCEISSIVSEIFSGVIPTIPEERERERVYSAWKQISWNK